MVADRYCYPARRDSVAFSNVYAVFGIVVLGGFVCLAVGVCRGS